MGKTEENEKCGCAFCKPGPVRDFFDQAETREELRSGKYKYMKDEVLADVRQRLEDAAKENSVFGDKVQDMVDGLGLEGDERYLILVLSYAAEESNRTKMFEASKNISEMIEMLADLKKEEVVNG
jgi:molybdopterin synthase catalytic subunit